MNNIMCTSLTLSYNQIREEMCKIWRVIHVCPKVSMVLIAQIFVRLTVTQYSFVDISCTEFYLKQAKYVENMCKISDISLCKGMAFIARYPCNSLSFKCIKWRSPTLNFTQTQKMRVDFHLYTSVKYDCWPYSQKLLT
jgi:hypothetical protein